MGRAKYDWRGAESAVRIALVEIFAAQRHIAYGKRVNALNELLAAEAEIAKARRALEAGAGAVQEAR